LPQVDDERMQWPDELSKALAIRRDFIEAHLHQKEIGKVAMKELAV